eukprot:365852-Chlamydomonas_euryale.AAC.12
MPSHLMLPKQHRRALFQLHEAVGAEAELPKRQRLLFACRRQKLPERHVPQPAHERTARLVVLAAAIAVVVARRATSRHAKQQRHGQVIATVCGHVHDVARYCNAHRRGSAARGGGRRLQHRRLRPPTRLWHRDRQRHALHRTTDILDGVRHDLRVETHAHVRVCVRVWGVDHVRA